MNIMGRISKQDQRYVLLENICKKYYDYDERRVVVQLPIKKYKYYVYTYFDSPTHPVYTIDVVVIDDFDLWYVNYCVYDTYNSHIKDSYIYTFGINRIPYDDQRYVMLKNVNEKYYDYDERCVVVELPIKESKKYVYTYHDSPTHPMYTIETVVLDDFDSCYISDGIYDNYEYVNESFVYTFGINRIPHFDERYQILKNNLSFRVQ
jgi:hypothetical protein